MLGSSAMAQEGQSGSEAQTGLSDIRASVQAARRELMREEMFLTDEEAAVFWPIYEEYRQEVSTVGDKYATLITRFAELYNAGEMSGEDAESFVDEHMKIEAAILKIEKKYIHKMRTVMSQLKVTRFYQLENKMNTETDVQLALAIPLVDLE